MTGYVRKFEGNTTISFQISDKQLFKKYNEMSYIQGKYINKKIQTYDDSVITNFHNKKMPQENTTCICLSIIMLDSVIKAKKKYYPQTLLEECKYEQEKIKMENLIDDDLEKSLSDESDNDSNDETEFDNDESNE